MKCYLILICCLAFNIAPLNLSAQEKEYIFKNFTQEEGLPSNEAYYIFEDSRHYIWIATDLGVVRFNGKKIEQFDLPDKVVFKIKEDSKGRIWFFSHTAQLAYFENEKIHPYKFNAEIRSRIKKIEIIEAYVDSADNITLNSSIDSNYVISASGHITSYNYAIVQHISTEFKLNYLSEKNYSVQKTISGAWGSDTLLLHINNGSKVTSYTIPVKFPPTPHYGVVANNKKEIYFFGGKTLIKLKQDGSYVFQQMANDILSLRLDSGNLWVGMRKGGALLLDASSLQATETMVFTNKSVSSIQLDYEGGLWLSTLENGVFYIKNTQIIHAKIDSKENPEILRMLNVNDSMLIYANSSGIFKFNKMKSYPLWKLKNYSTTDLLIDKKVLYYLGGVFIRRNIFKSTDPYFRYFYLLASTAEGILKKNTIIYSDGNSVEKYKSSFDPDKKLISVIDTNYLLFGKQILDKPSKLFFDIYSNIWAGNNDGLYKSNSGNDTLIKFKESSPLLSNGVNCIRQMQNGIMILGIRQGGIALLKDTNIIGTITESTGLPSNKIKYILPIGNKLWVATAKGISVIVITGYNPLKYTITQIGKNDGFFNLTINQLIKYKDNIVAATSSGLYFINEPDKFLDKVLPVIPFYITSVSTSSTDTSAVNAISLPYSKNRLLIKYSAVSFNVADEISYLYRLDNSDSTWSATTNNELLIDNLKPGTYNFQIKAVALHQKRSSEIITLKITIEKPWWQNNWLRLILAILLPLLVYIYFRKRIEKIRREEKRKTTLYGRIHELEQAAFRSQMNPHFIFNCLTSIQQLILKGNKMEASEYLVKFSRLIRKTMDLSLVPFITINGEIEYLTEYLMLEQLRMPGQFTYKLTVANIDEPDKMQIPNMMLQPLIENSIRHGIKPLENRKGMLTVHFELNHEFVKCTVTDNGVGRDNINDFKNNLYAEHKSHGLDIIKKRLSVITEINQLEMEFEIKDLHLDNGLSAGTQVIIQLPYKYKT
ncbi:histidine kinase [Ferruginibacter paludis]|uniref:sensor histidine kinase n=1 Tax=Ferruginibacter paludis TaxID=1310417 RepID=UPI0025B4DFFC|nr:sensor histidine kinase [Ferruginibacter paludis]MDN3655525.1 histidine kinase [Ferruginibacter paludis]